MARASAVLNRVVHAIAEESRSRNAFASAVRSQWLFAAVAPIRPSPRGSTRATISSVAVLVIVLALAACGVGGSPKDAIRSTATQYAKALSERDAAKACDLMSSEAKRLIVAAHAPSGGRDCPTVIKNVVVSLDDSVRRELRDYRVTKVEIAGDRASVEDNAALNPGETGGGRRPMVKEGDRWLMAGPDR
jgi:hypothetical protein